MEGEKKAGKGGVGGKGMGLGLGAGKRPVSLNSLMGTWFIFFFLLLIQRKVWVLTRSLLFGGDVGVEDDESDQESASSDE